PLLPAVESEAYGSYARRRRAHRRVPHWNPESTRLHVPGPGPGRCSTPKSRRWKQRLRTGFFSWCALGGSDRRPSLGNATRSPHLTRVAPDPRMRAVFDLPAGVTNVVGEICETVDKKRSDVRLSGDNGSSTCTLWQRLPPPRTPGRQGDSSCASTQS